MIEGRKRGRREREKKYNAGEDIYAWQLCPATSMTEVK